MLVSRNVCHVVSALQSIVFIHIFSADQASCRSYFGSVYRMRSIAVCVRASKAFWTAFNAKSRSEFLTMPLTLAVEASQFVGLKEKKKQASRLLGEQDPQDQVLTP